MKIRMLALLALIASVPAQAVFPAKINLVLKDKMSCREVKKLFQIDSFYVQCDQKLGKEWSAHYFGKDSIDAVIRKIASYAKVETATPGS